MWEWKDYTVVIQSKIASRLLHQFSKRTVSAQSARAPDRSHSKQGTETVPSLPSCSSLCTKVSVLFFQGQVATCTVIHLLNFRRETFFSQCLVETLLNYFVIFSSLPPFKPPTLVMATQSWTRARLRMHRAIPHHHATPWALICTHMPVLISLGWKLPGAKAAFLPCCLHST